jgi:hypothetical protein
LVTLIAEAFEEEYQAELQREKNLGLNKEE